MTNYEKIKAMSIDEMSNLFGNTDGDCLACFGPGGKADYGCKECARHWLEQEENKSED